MSYSIYILLYNNGYNYNGNNDNSNRINNTYCNFIEFAVLFYFCLKNDPILE